MASTVLVAHAAPGMLLSDATSKPVRRRYGNSSTVVQRRAATVAPSAQVAHILKDIAIDPAVCATIVDILVANEHSEPFRAPVDRDLFPHYYTVIKRPIDLSTIRSKIGNGIYRVWSEFISDLELMFANCRAFNHPSLEVSRLGRQLEEVFHSEIFKAAKQLSKGENSGNVSNASANQQHATTEERDRHVNAAANVVRQRSTAIGQVSQPSANQEKPTNQEKPRQSTAGAKKKSPKIRTEAGTEVRAGPIRKLFQDYVASRANAAAAQSSTTNQTQGAAPLIIHQTDCPTNSSPSETDGSAVLTQKNKQSASNRKRKDLPMESSPGQSGLQTSSSPLIKAEVKRKKVTNVLGASPPALLAIRQNVAEESLEPISNQGASLSANSDDELDATEEEDSRLLDKPPRSTVAQKQARRTKRAEQLRQWKQRTEKESREERMRKRRGEHQETIDVTSGDGRPRVRWSEDLAFYSIFSHLASDDES